MANLLYETEVMNKTFTLHEHTIPEKPGVYLMKDVSGVVLYVGKAKNLLLRLKSYFSHEGGDGRPQIPFLLEKVCDVETYVVSSEEEALLLEAQLIFQYKPHYNVLLKEDSSEFFLHIDLKHPFPALRIVRVSIQRSNENGVSLSSSNYFGPLSHFYAASLLVDLLVRLFRLRQCRDEEFKRRTRPCLLYQLKKCHAPCIYHDTHVYEASVQQAVSALQGKDKAVVKQLTEEIQKASEALDFEKASFLLKQLRSLEEVLSKKGAQKIKGVSDADVVAFAQSDTSSCMCVMRYRKSILVSTVSFVFENRVLSQDEDVSSLLFQYYRLSDTLAPPKEILFFKGIVEQAAVQEALSRFLRRPVQLIDSCKGKKRELLLLAEENARIRLLQKTSQKISAQELLVRTQECLELEKTPFVIDCFDVSHLSGKECVAACISFVDGIPYKRMYRRFLLRSKGDDCSMMREAIERRYRSIKEADRLPDLLVVDGGKLQLRAALEALKECGFIGCIVCALSKEEGRHDKGLTKEKIWRSWDTVPILLERRSGVLQFLQRVRDEAHRFSLAYQKKRRTKSLFS